jgi:hypothetical protein
VWREHLAGHQDELAELPSHVPEVYLAVSLQPARAAGPVAGLLAAGDRARRRLEDTLGVGAQRPIAANEIEALLNAEERIHARVVNAFGVGAARRATTDELQWLLRRSACRGLGEPVHDPHWQPGAVLVEAPDGKVAYEPRTTDLLRFANAPILEEPRALVSLLKVAALEHAGEHRRRDRLRGAEGRRARRRVAPQRPHAG